MASEKSRVFKGKSTGVSCALLGLWAVASYVMLATACRRPPPQPNVVLITIDTLRADHTSAYGYPLATTPYLESLSRESTRIENAYAPMPTTLPSHTSIFTSKFPIVHGTVRNGMIVAEEQRLLPEILKAQGYNTAAFVSSHVLGQTVGLNRGFDTYDDDFRRAGEGNGSLDRRAAHTTKRAAQWLDENASDGRFFLWVHYFDPHSPYDPPEDLRRKYLAPEWKKGDLRRPTALYDAEVESTDRALSRLIQKLDSVVPPGETLLIVTSDHGEGLNDHGYMGHGPILYEETLRVPLFFRWAGWIAGGKTVSGPTEHVDLMPTILGLLGINTDDTLLQGRDLSASLTSNAGLDEEWPMFFQRRLYDASHTTSPPVEGVRYDSPLRVRGAKFATLRHPWKYIAAEAEGTSELYDLRRDPHERTNLADSNPAVMTELATMMAQWREEQMKLSLGIGTDTSEEHLERLRALGYVR